MVAGDDLMFLCVMLNKFFYFECVFNFFKNFIPNGVVANPPLDRSFQHDGASGFPMISKFRKFLKNLEIFKIFKIIFIFDVNVSGRHIRPQFPQARNRGDLIGGVQHLMGC